MRRYGWMFLALVVGVTALGCSSSKKDEMLAAKDAEIARLQGQVDELQSNLREEEERAAQLNKELEEALADYKNKEQVWLEQKDANSIVNVSDAMLFASGSAELTPEGRQLIDKVVGVVKQHSDRAIRVEGHTDNVPIGPNLKDRYTSNWELSSARACSVIHYMQWNHKIEADRLSAIGYGEYRPIADNDTPEGRKRNRRVVIVIGPKL